MAETLFFNALREAIDEEMSRDSKVFVLGEDVGH
ncbi:MAG: alpha-ketoacid dehydrogenase subunit beta, partial [Dolichospermum sp.]